MGVKGLSKFLKTRCPSYVGRPLEPGNGFLAVDVPLFLHRYIFSVGPIGLIRSFDVLRQSMLSMGYRPIWVFDGGKLPLKDGERARRSLARAAIAETHVLVGPTRDDLQRVLSFCRQDDVKIAHYEAEALCAYLVHTGYAYAAVTHDTDVFAYACPRSLLDVSTSVTQGKLIVFDDLLQDLKMSKDTFQKACVLCGNDFCLNERNVGPVRAFAMADEKQVNETVLQIFQSCCYQDKCKEPVLDEGPESLSGPSETDSPNSLCKLGNPSEFPTSGLPDSTVSNEPFQTGPTSS